jgi:hypothetical protein
VNPSCFVSVCDSAHPRSWRSNRVVEARSCGNFLFELAFDDGDHPVRAHDGAGSSTSDVRCVLTPEDYEAESLSRSTSSATSSVVTYAGASAGSLVSATVNTVGGWVELTTTTPATGVYGTKLRYLATPDAGRFVVKVGGVLYGSEVDGYAASPTFREVYLGEVDIPDVGATRKLRFELSGRNSLSTGKKIQIDVITLTVAQFRYEGESSSAVTSSGDSQSNSNVSGASNGKVNAASLNAVGDYVRYTIAAGAPGTYAVNLLIRKGTNRGRFRAWLDETTALGSEVDGYASSNTLVVVALGETTIVASGNHTVKLQVTGKNLSASSYGVTADYLGLRLAAGNGCSLFGDAIPDGTACNDASLCTQNDTCQGGACTGSTSVVCIHRTSATPQALVIWAPANARIRPSRTAPVAATATPAPRPTPVRRGLARAAIPLNACRRRPGPSASPPPATRATASA